MLPMKSSEQAEKLIEKGKAVLATHKPNPPNVIGFPTLDNAAFSEWQSQCLNFITRVAGKDHIYTQKFLSEVEEPYTSQANAGIGIIRAICQDLLSGALGQDAVEVDSIALVENICSRFHLVARQLRQRHEGRNTLEVEDEYDIQDLFHVLLTLYFDDIRPEEYTPSYAGKASRLDFLMKKEQLVVELKKTRKGLDARELSKQLIEDIERYKSHPNCRTLICFVYDPDGYIANPRGIEADLNREVPYKVKVLIYP
jgi:hypothetical protein